MIISAQNNLSIGTEGPIQRGSSDLRDFTFGECIIILGWRCSVQTFRRHVRECRKRFNGPVGSRRGRLSWDQVWELKRNLAEIRRQKRSFTHVNGK